MKSLYKSIQSDNLEKTLNILYAKKYYLQGCIKTDDKDKKYVDELIDFIQEQIYSKINIDLACMTATDTLDLYKKFYQKVTLRNKDLSRVNVFTNNNDLFHEKVLDNLNIKLQQRFWWWNRKGI